MCVCKGEFFNYEICIRDETNPMMSDLMPLKYFYIDDGPYFRTLSHLIEHYTKYEDGLPGVLKRNVEPAMLQHLNMPNPSNSLLKPVMNINSKPPAIPNTMQPNLLQANMIQSSSSSISNSSSSNGLSQRTANPDQPFNRGGNNNSGGANNSSGGDTNGFKSSDALTKAHLFKSRTLLNDQSNENLKNYYLIFD